MWPGLRLQLASGKTFIGTIDIDAALQIRLNAFAKANKKKRLDEMIDLALRVALADDGKTPKMFVPDEGEIMDMAARMLGDLKHESGRS
jgi:hypothetical protein